jgi:phosphoglycolate phosphatase-like HAD superfamily hydrolase
MERSPRERPQLSRKALGGTTMEAVIFDIDGTLLQSDTTDDTLYLVSVRQVLGNVKVRQSWGMYTQFTAAGILAEILGDNAVQVTPETVAAVRDCFVASVGRHISARGPFAEVPGAKAFVQSLHKSTTHRVAYATGGWLGAALLKLSASEFPVTGIPLATSDDHVERQEIMLHALRRLGDTFDAVTYYGDGHWDAEAAKSLGWQFVPVGRRLNGLTRYGSGAA